MRCIDGWIAQPAVIAIQHHCAVCALECVGVKYRLLSTRPVENMVLLLDRLLGGAEGKQSRYVPSMAMRCMCSLTYMGVMYQLWAERCSR